MDRVRAWIGLGANLGDARAAIAGAIAALAGLEDSRLAAVSSLYHSAPVDAGGPDYLNAAAALDTGLPPQRLLEALLAIERSHGRERPYRNAPRTLDIDLLAWGDAVLDTPTLTLPHPRLHLRAFVLAPLLEIDPALRLPGLPPLPGLLAACAGQPIEPVLPAADLLAAARATTTTGTCAP